MHFIFSTGSLYSYGLDRCFALAAEAGFDGIELMIDQRWDTRQPDYLKGLVERYDLPIQAVHSPFRLNLSGFARSEADAIERSAKLAEEVGAAVVIHHLPERVSWTPLQVGSHRFPFLQPWRKDQDEYAEWLEGPYRRLQESLSVLLCIENLPHRIVAGRPFNPARWNAHDRASISDITRFAHITMDTTHLATWGLDPSEIFMRWGSRVKHIHLSNYDGREHRRPEDGRLALDQLIARVAQAGYEHSISLELHPDALEAGASDERVVELMGNSLNWCRRAAENAATREFETVPEAEMQP